MRESERVTLKVAVLTKCIQHSNAAWHTLSPDPLCSLKLRLLLKLSKLCFVEKNKNKKTIAEFIHLACLFYKWGRTRSMRCPELRHRVSITLSEESTVCPLPQTWGHIFPWLACGAVIDREGRASHPFHPESMASFAFLDGCGIFRIRTFNLKEWNTIISLFFFFLLLGLTRFWTWRDKCKSETYFTSGKTVALLVC